MFLFVGHWHGSLSIYNRGNLPWLCPWEGFILQQKGILQHIGVVPVTLLCQVQDNFSWLHYPEVCLYEIEASSGFWDPEEGSFYKSKDSSALGSRACNPSSSVQGDFLLASLHESLPIWNGGIFWVLRYWEGLFYRPGPPLLEQRVSVIHTHITHS